MLRTLKGDKKIETLFEKGFLLKKKTFFLRVMILEKKSLFLE